MEIQSFLLCKNIVRGVDGRGYDGAQMALHSFYSLDGIFPLKFALPYLMLLRRETRGPEQSISLRFNLINGDGITAGEPRNHRADGIFPANFMFMTLNGRINFSFPAPGDYRLDITADEDSNAFTFQYNIEITKPV